MAIDAVAVEHTPTRNSVNKLTLFEDWSTNLENIFKAIDYRQPESSIVTPDQLTAVGDLISAQPISTILPKV